jgi:drug/metabolite transporter (DMT)-like permease
MHLSRTSSTSPLAVATNLGIVYVVWGSTYLAIRLVIDTLPPFLAAGTRFLVAGALMLGFLWARARLSSSPERQIERIEWRHWRSAAIIGALLLFGGNGLVSQAERSVDSGIAAVLIAAVPIWMNLFEAIVTRRRPGLLVIGGVVAGFAGIGILLAPVQGLPAIDPIGIGMLVVAAICWASGSVYARHAPMPRSGMLGTGLEMVAGGAVLMIAGALVGEPNRLDIGGVSLSSVLGLAYLIVFGSLVAFSAYTWLLQRAPVSTVATYAYVNPIVAVALGTIFLHEAITPRTILASVVIIGAVVAMVSGRPREAEEAAPFDIAEAEGEASVERDRRNGIDRAAAD